MYLYTRINWISALSLCFPAPLFVNILPACRMARNIPMWLSIMATVGTKTQHTLTLTMYIFPATGKKNRFISTLK